MNILASDTSGGTEILLCDERQSALNQASKEDVEDALEQLNTEEHIGMILVTHRDFVPKQVDARRFVLQAHALEEVSA